MPQVNMTSHWFTRFCALASNRTVIQTPWAIRLPITDLQALPARSDCAASSTGVAELSPLNMRIVVRLIVTPNRQKLLTTSRPPVSRYANLICAKMGARSTSRPKRIAPALRRTRHHPVWDKLPQPFTAARFGAKWPKGVNDVATPVYRAEFPTCWLTSDHTYLSCVTPSG